MRGTMRCVVQCPASSSSADCRERGGRALEERLAARKAVPAVAVAHDLEAGTAHEVLAESNKVPQPLE